jgi:hypothetical protein
MISFCEMGQEKKKKKPFCEIHHLKFSVEKGKISLKKNSWFQTQFQAI